MIWGKVFVITAENTGETLKPADFKVAVTIVALSSAVRSTA